MLSYSVKKIHFFSIVKVSSIVFVMSGIIFGFVLFLFSTLTSDINFTVRLLLSVCLTLIYIIFMFLFIIISVLIYNFIAEKLGCNIVIFIEQKKY
jgi:hypothetical protein